MLIEAIKAQGLVLEERPFTVAEAHAAREAFVTAASQIVMPVVRIDGRPVGTGKPGPGRHGATTQFSPAMPNGPEGT